MELKNQTDSALEHYGYLVDYVLDCLGNNNFISSLKKINNFQNDVLDNIDGSYRIDTYVNLTDHLRELVKRTYERKYQELGGQIQ